MMKDIADSFNKVDDLLKRKVTDKDILLYFSVALTDMKRLVRELTISKEILEESIKICEEGLKVNDEEARVVLKRFLSVFPAICLKIMEENEKVRVLIHLEDVDIFDRYIQILNKRYDRIVLDVIMWKG